MWKAIEWHLDSEKVIISCIVSKDDTYDMISMQYRHNNEDEYVDGLYFLYHCIYEFCCTLQTDYRYYRNDINETHFKETIDFLKTLDVQELIELKELFEEIKCKSGFDGLWRDK